MTDKKHTADSRVDDNLERCGNCDRAIGKLESPFVWRDTVVCQECFRHLNSDGAKDVPTHSAISSAVSAGRPRPVARAARRRSIWSPIILAGGVFVVFAILAGGGWMMMHRSSGITTNEGPQGGAQGTPYTPANSPVTDLFTAKATIKGGAWIVRKSGDSTLLRGLEVQLIRDSNIDGARVRDVCVPYLQQLQGEIDEAKKNLTQESAAEDERDKLDRDEGLPVNRITTMEDFYRKEITELNDLLDDRKSDITKIGPKEGVATAYEHAKKAASYFGEPQVGKMFDPLVAATTHADSEGRYSFLNVPKGKYYVFADFDSANGTVQWLVPIEVKKTGELNCDLFNDNAEIIRNKD